MAIAAAASWPTRAHAHPHAWIDLRSKVVFDDRGHVTALRLEWLFDELYSAYATAHMARVGGKPAPEALAQLARINLDNLADYQYFTDVRIDGRRLRIERVTDPESTFANKRLRMAFTVHLPEPADPRKHRMTFAVYDPTYYIEIAYLPGDPVGLVNAGDTGCTASIEGPEPNSEVRSLAGAYGRDETIDETVAAAITGQPGTTIGEILADKAIIECR